MSRVRKYSDEEYYNSRDEHRDSYREYRKDSKNKSSPSRDYSDLDEDNRCTVMSFDKTYQPRQMTNFDHSKFPSAFQRVFEEQGFKRPTPIQSYGIPIGMDHKDIIGIAKTGSGKTLAFILPGICEIMEEKKYLMKHGSYDNRKTPLGLVIAPTRELAVQIHQHSIPFCRAIGISVSCIYGGAETYPQRNELNNGVDLLIATPGRLLDFVERHHVYLSKAIYFVIDEADRMLDMGFIPQVKKIVEELKPRRQTLLFSATWPKEVEVLSDEICKNNPVKIKVGNTDQYTVNKDIKQNIEMIDEYDKKDRLMSLLKQIAIDRHHKILIFTKTKKGCDRLTRILEGMYSSNGIHGDKPQNLRQKIINDFKKNYIKILVATDVASRGIDVKDIKHVINYDFPQTIEDYIHRIGRTGRAGARGDSITFFTNEDGGQAKDLIDVLTRCDKKVPTGLYDLAEKLKFRRKRRFGYDGCMKSYWKSAKSGFGGTGNLGDDKRRDRSRSRDRGPGSRGPQSFGNRGSNGNN